MDHVSRDGITKFRRRCTLPLMGSNAVDMLVTDLAVFARGNRRGHFHRIELAGVAARPIRPATEAHYEVA